MTCHLHVALMILVTAGNFATGYDASPLSLLFLPSWLLSHLAPIHCKGNTLFKGEYTLARVMSTKKRYL